MVFSDGGFRSHRGEVSGGGSVGVFAAEDLSR